MSRKSVVGLDIGSTGIRAVEVKGRPGSLRLAKAASIDLPRGAWVDGEIVDDKAVVTALKKLWKKGRFSTRRVVYGLSDPHILTRQMDLPWMAEEDFREALRFQVGDALPVDAATVEMDYHLLGEIQGTDERGVGARMNRILLVAADREGIRREASILPKAGLEPVGADSPSFALIRAACQGIVPSDGKAHALVDIGAEQLTLVVYQDGQPLFIRTVTNVGGAIATTAIAEALHVDPEEAEALKVATGLNGPAPVVAPVAESAIFSSGDDTAPLDPRAAETMAALAPWAATIVGEIRNSLEYFHASSPGVEISDLSLTGRTVALAGVRERIATEVPVPVRTLDPFLGLPHARRLTKEPVPDTRLAVAGGLAMGGAA